MGGSAYAFLGSTITPTKAPTKAPTNTPTKAPTKAPNNSPTKAPTKAPTKTPTKAPTKAPTNTPTKAPTITPTRAPTNSPTNILTNSPTNAPSVALTLTFSQVVSCNLDGGASSYTGDLKTASEAGYFSELGIMTKKYTFAPGCSGTSSASGRTRRSSVDITFEISSIPAGIAGAYSLSTVQLTHAISTASANLGFNLPAPSITSIST